MRTLLVFTTILLLTLSLTACEADEGGAQGQRQRSDTQSSHDGGGGDTLVADPCANGQQDPDESDVDCGGPCAACALGQGCVTGADCASGLCGTGYVCQDAACGNGVQDPGETGTDCGGPCPKCLGEACGAHEDCASGYCAEGACAAPSCTDGVKNGSETGTDCGGDCAQCPDGEGCVGDVHCLSGFCKDGHCASPSCDDGWQNQNETDVDCGGTCGGCANGNQCNNGNDCTSGRCAEGTCAEVQPACDDGVKNGSESDVDCGGGCAGCGFGKACAGSGDCTSGLCEQGLCAAPASCDDGEVNGGESDVDCGGPCTPCATDKFCSEHADCLSLTCIYGKCKEPTCSDGVQNQGESDLDCGGPCAPCPDGKQCGGAGDCASGDCASGVCVSCSDGVKSGGESDVDCGGPCGACPLGAACLVAGDCLSGACEGGICCSPNLCGTCGAAPAEICDGLDNDCDVFVDEAVDIGAPPPCAKQQGVCAGSVSACRGAQGWQCDDDAYQAHHARYEPVEQMCDGFDNDCDGQVDEHQACAACGAFSPVTVESHPGNHEYKVYKHGWLTTLDGVAFAVATHGDWGDDRVLTLYRIDDGAVTGEWELGAGYAGYPSIVAGADALHVGASTAVYESFNSTNTMEYFKVTPQGVVSVHETVITVVADSSSPAIVVLGLGKVYLGYFTNENLDRHTFAKRLGPGSWEQQGTLWGRGDEGFQFVVQPSAKLHTIYADTFHEIEAWTGPMTGDSGSGSIPDLTSNDGFDPVLRLGPGDALHAAFIEEDYSGEHRYAEYLPNPSGENYGWTDTELHVEADKASLALTPAHMPVMVWTTPTNALVIADRNGGDWGDTQLAGLPGEVDALTLAIDSHDRRHVAWVIERDEAPANRELRYGVVCATSSGCTPACGGKMCGPDGCGGACGACPAGQSCNASGQCVGGDDPCGGLTYEGCCDGSTVVWCEGEQIKTYDCANEPSCGWSAADAYYWCNTAGDSDPSATFPKDCPF
jgi:hypothetical protein